MLEESKDFTCRPIDEAGLRRFERRKGIAFPEPLRSALLKVNGGKLDSNVFKRGSAIYIIHGIYGLVLNGPGSPRMRAISEDVQQAHNTKDAGDPAKIFLISCEWPLDWYWALNFNTSSSDPSIWIIERSGSHSPSRQIFENWRDLEACLYYGDEVSEVDFSKWSDGKVLVDHHGKEPMLRQRMVLRDGVICLQHELACTEAIERSERCFVLAGLNRQTLRMQHEVEEMPEIGITFAARSVSSVNSKLLGERWFNGRRHLNSKANDDDGHLRFDSFEQAVETFRLLAGDH